MSQRAVFGQSQRLALITETEEAVTLASVGLKTLEQLHHVIDEAAAVMTMLSISSEKLLKLAYGLCAVNVGRPWPSVKQMRSHGHHILELDREVRDLYLVNVDNATHPAYISQLLTRVDGDPYLPGLLGVLDRWGDQGRFHRLDELAGAPQDDEPAPALWKALELQIIESDPALLEGLISVAGYEAARTRINELLAESYRNWWALHTRAWMQGVLGEEGRSISVTLSRVAS
jgi:hypothetical protein